MNENEFPEEVIRHLRQMADEPPPEPSAALGQFLADPSSVLAPAGVAATLAESGLTGAATHPTKESRMKTLFARMGMAGRVALITGLIAAAGVGTAAAATAVNLVTGDEPTTSVELPTVTDDDQVDVAEDQGDDSQSGAVSDDKADDDQGDNNQGDNNQGDNAADQGDDNGVVSQSDDTTDDTTGDDQGDDPAADDQGDDQGDNDQGDDSGTGNSGNDQGDDDQGDDSAADDQGDDSGNDNSGSSSGSDDQSDDSGDASDGGDSQDD